MQLLKDDGEIQKLIERIMTIESCTQTNQLLIPHFRYNTITGRRLQTNHVSLFDEVTITVQ